VLKFSFFSFSRLLCLSNIHSLLDSIYLFLLLSERYPEVISLADADFFISPFKKFSFLPRLLRHPHSLLTSDVKICATVTPFFFHLWRNPSIIGRTPPSSFQSLFFLFFLQQLLFSPGDVSIFPPMKFLSYYSLRATCGFAAFYLSIKALKTFPLPSYVY